MSANETIRNKYLSQISLWNCHFLFIYHKVSFTTNKSIYSVWEGWRGTKWKQLCVYRQANKFIKLKF